MKAVIQERYGPAAEVLQLREVDRPTIGDDELLVRVHSASVNVDVWHTINGVPYVLRLMGAGFTRPKNPTPGIDMAGVVESVGKNISLFAPGDRVFGETRHGIQWTNGGAFAEYVPVAETSLSRIPENTTFEEAASIPASGFIAISNLHRVGKPLRGTKVLINGAGGAVGSIALQIIKARGGHVTGVDNTQKLEMLRSLGADEVMDYTEEDITKVEAQFDLIFDVASNLTTAECKRILLPDGVRIIIGHDHFGKAAGRVLGSLPRILGLTLLSPFIKQMPKIDFSEPSQSEVMHELAELLEQGKLTPTIEKTFPLEEASLALGYLESGRAQGKILIAP